MEIFDKHQQCNGSLNGDPKHSVWLIKFAACIVLLFLNFAAYNQDRETDSLLQVAAKGKDDSLKVNALISLTVLNLQSAPDKAIEFGNSAKTLAVKIGFKKGEAYAYKWLGIIYDFRGNYYEALVNSNKSLNIFEAVDDKIGISNLLNNLGAFYADKGEDSKAVEYYLKSLDLAMQSGNALRIESALSNIGVTYSKNPATNDEALKYYLKALPYALEIKDDESTGIIYTNIGEAYTAKNEFDKAYTNYDKALHILGTSSSTAYTYNDLGKLYQKKKDYDSANIYFDKAYLVAQQNNSPVDVLQSLIGKAQLKTAIGNTKDAIALFDKALTIGKPLESTPELKEVYEGLSAAYKNLNDYKKAFSFQSLLSELYTSENEKKLSFNTATLEYTMELQKQSGKIAMLIKENELQGSDLAKERLARNISIGSLTVVLIITVILLIYINQRKKLNRLLSIQNKKIEAQKISVENALVELKSAQSQLIHSEKMASLGELTAGVAHEIQNPLNFVNNFSELNNELIEDMNSENDITEIKAIANNIKQNNQKIAFHGNRADAIVKGMLQHSRQTKGIKEPTDINALCEEYLRLSYHGLVAKDKKFNAGFKTEMDETIGKINVIPQDIGRALLNIFNNAFYAVNEKKKLSANSYLPLAKVSTGKLNNVIEIRVEDNGNGIPQNIIDKIFQPFFTTKPTGEGTGLGLSLSYDIIKAHGGEIKVNTKEGEGSVFIIQLPVA